jgi:hypothetical protein
MQNHSEHGDVALAGAPSWCVDPDHCEHPSAIGKKCGKCRSVPHLHSSASNLSEGSRSVWVYYPQGIQRRPLAESDLNSGRATDARRFPPHACGGTKSATELLEEKEEAPFPAPHPGHSLFQDSFHFCKFKKLGDTPGLDDVYLEIVLDEYSGLAFAKVYADKKAMAAADILSTRVVPFFNRLGVPIEQIFTRNTKEYCGLAPIHPYETFLATSHIRHEQADLFDESRRPICVNFFSVLQQDFLPNALRRRFQPSLDILQRDLDDFVNTYNSSCPNPAPGLHGFPAMRAFLDTVQA